MEDRAEEAAEASVPLQRVGTAEDVAVYLATGAVAHVTGEMIDAG